MTSSFRTAFALFAMVAGCGSGDSTTQFTDASAEAGAEGGPSDSVSADGAMCIASGNACGPSPEGCVGDCRGLTCCSGLCALDTCGDTNVSGGTCPTGCGGNPEGTWHLVGACNARSCTGDKKATVVSKQESWVVSATGGTTLDWGYDLRCGKTATSGGNTIEGTWSSTDSKIGGFSYCVRSGRLWVMSGDYFSLEFAR